MAKKRPQTKAVKPQISDGEIPVVGAREPCPCGSGRRYKACHGRAAAHAVTELVQRPFEGLAGECDWVALRELVPAATVPLTLKDGLPEGVPSVTLATVLPMAWPALRREDGSVLLGLQNDTPSGDISRDLADTLRRALVAEPGSPVAARRADVRRRPASRTCSTPPPRSSPRCTPASSSGCRTRTAPPPRSPPPWSAPTPPRSRPYGSTSVDSSYWCETPEKNHLRWVMPHPEEKLLDALARLHAAGTSSLGEGTRLRRLVPGARPDRAGVGPAGRRWAPRSARSRRPRSPNGSPGRSRPRSR